MLHTIEVEWHISCGYPVEWTHGEVVILVFADCELLCMIIGGVECVAGVELSLPFL